MYSLQLIQHRQITKETLAENYKEIIYIAFVDGVLATHEPPLNAVIFMELVHKASLSLSLSLSLNVGPNHVINLKGLTRPPVRMSVAQVRRQDRLFIS
jgi:hypothetical protein